MHTYTYQVVCKHKYIYIYLNTYIFLIILMSLETTDISAAQLLIGHHHPVKPTIRLNQLSLP